jgi:hypothetical protein
MFNHLLRIKLITRRIRCSATGPCGAGLRRGQEGRAGLVRALSLLDQLRHLALRPTLGAQEFLGSLHEDVFRYGTAHRLQVAAEFSVKDSMPAAIVIEALDVK